MMTLVIFQVLGFWIVFADSARSRSGCQPEKLALCTDPLRVITNNQDLGFATSRAEFEAMCPKLLGGLECISKYTRKCLDRDDREFFHILYAGTEVVIKDLCLDRSFQDEYLKHALCMRSAQSGYARCASTYQEEVQSTGQTDDFGGGFEEDLLDTSKKLCCSFRSYMSCSQKAVLSTCGQVTSDFTGSFLDRMAGPLIQGYCLTFKPGQSCDGETIELLDYDLAYPREEDQVEGAEHSSSVSHIVDGYTWLIFYLFITQLY